MQDCWHQNSVKRPNVSEVLKFFKKPTDGWRPNHNLTQISDRPKLFSPRMSHMADLNETIDHYPEALTLCPDGNPDLPTSLNYLADVLQSQFELTGQVGNLDEAVQYRRAALALCPEGHPYHPDYLSNLAIALQMRSGNSGRSCSFVSYQYLPSVVLNFPK
jgi:tetratricopeptide (TPR) repeat protein